MNSYKFYYITFKNFKNLFKFHIYKLYINQIFQKVNQILTLEKFYNIMYFLQETSLLKA